MKSVIFRVSSCLQRRFNILQKGVGVVFLLLSVLILPADLPAAESKPTINIYIFSSPDCERCGVIKKDNLFKLAEKFQCIIKPEYFNVERMENYKLLMQLEEKYKDTDNELPVVFIGKYALGGVEEIEKNIGAVIKEYADKGGCPCPGEEKREDKTPKTVSDKSDKNVHLAYFYKPGCRKCRRIHHLLNYLENEHSNLKVKRFNLSEKKNKLVAEALCEDYNVPRKKRLTPTLIFVGENRLCDGEVNRAGLEGLIKSSSQTGTVCPWELSEKELIQAKESIISRFKSFGPLAILTAGLVDGINPCAFTTLIFFVSYLSFAGRKGKEILLVGSCFTLAVFTAYLLLGCGALSIIQRLSNFSFLSRIIRTSTILLALFLGGFSLYDFFKAKKGKMKEIKLQLPKLLKRRIQLTITREMRIRGYLIAAFTAGFIVSILELACTGQVYFPTIIFVNSQAGMSRQGLSYLLLYNLMFILPLIIVFILVFFGTSSEALTRFTKRHLATVKLFTSLFFFGLAGLLMVT